MLVPMAFGGGTRKRGKEGGKLNVSSPLPMLQPVPLPSTPVPPPLPEPSSTLPVALLAQPRVRRASVTGLRNWGAGSVTRAP